jgi:hypothetical protein
MPDVKTATVAAMRAALDEHYTKHPTSATVSVPLPVLASAAQAAVAEVGIDRIPAIPAYDPDVTPHLHWVEETSGFDPGHGFGGIKLENDGTVRIRRYLGSTPQDKPVRLTKADARAFALAILSAVTEADSND